MNVYNAWAETNFAAQWCFENFVQVRSMKRARDVRDQVLGLMERCEIELISNPGDVDAIRKAVTSGFFYHTANLQKNGSYKTVKNPQSVFIHPSSGLSESLPRWVVYHELVLTSKEYMRTVSEIKPEWLVDIAPHYYSAKEIMDKSSKKLPKTLGRAADGS
jgi:pre-mRNA-splicing factor ATP-dependent RNA helicase DHX16